MLNRKQYNNVVIQQLNNFKEAFSLVELLIGILLIGLISTFIASIYYSQFKLFTGQNLAVSVAAENKIAMDDIVNNTRQAVQIPQYCSRNYCEANSTCSGLACVSRYLTTGPTVLILILPPLDSSGNVIEYTIIAGCYPDYVSYYLDSPTGPAPGPDGYSVLKRETAQLAASNCQSSRQRGVDIIATKVKSINFEYTPAPPNATEVKTSVTTEASTFFKPLNPYGIARTTSTRLKNRAGGNYVQIPFPYVVMSGYSSNFANTTIVGNVSSNGNLSCLFSCPTTMINGDAYAYGSISSVAVNPGPPHPNSGTRPLPTIDENYWMTAAQSGMSPEICAGGTCTIAADTPVGPKHYTGNVTINSDVKVTISGPLYITGNLTLSNNSELRIDTAKCPVGTVIFVNKNIVIDGAKIFATSSSPPNFLLLVADFEEPSGALTIVNSAYLESIFLTRELGAGSIQASQLIGAVATDSALLVSNTPITYPSGGLNSALFSTCQ